MQGEGGEKSRVVFRSQSTLEWRAGRKDSHLGQRLGGGDQEQEEEQAWALVGGLGRQERPGLSDGMWRAGHRPCLGDGAGLALLQKSPCLTTAPATTGRAAFACRCLTEDSGQWNKGKRGQLQFQRTVRAVPSPGSTAHACAFSDGVPRGQQVRASPSKSYEPEDSSTALLITRSPCCAGPWAGHGGHGDSDPLSLPSKGSACGQNEIHIYSEFPEGPAVCC